MSNVQITSVNFSKKKQKQISSKKPTIIQAWINF
jgi:hypothetical protein